MRLTYATLGAFTKYPSTSIHALADDTYIGCKKHGFFKEDVAHFDEIANTLGLPRRSDTSWARHPLVFLVEAADDICYKIVDIEDGFKLGRISFAEAEECLVGMLGTGRAYRREPDQNSNIGWLRAAAIGSLIDNVQVAFEANELSILQGVFSEALVDASASASAVKVAKKLTIERVFDWDRTVLAEIAGSEMITFVLDRCMQAIFDPKPKMNSLIVKIIPGYTSDSDFLKKTLAVTDFVCGMTDGYLRSTYLKLFGHEILTVDQ